MKINDAISIWNELQQDLGPAYWQNLISDNKFELYHYAGFLQETYHQAGSNPQLQAFVTMFLKARPYNLITMFLNHAKSEMKHDLLALNDLKALGIDNDLILKSKPLPETEGFSSYVIKQIMFDSPVCYLGYLFHLEFNPTHNGPKYIEYLLNKNASKDSLTFLKEHSEVDVGHNNMMKTYLAELVKSDSDVSFFKYSLKCAIVLHNNLINAAIRNGEALYKNKLG